MLISQVTINAPVISSIIGNLNAVIFLKDFCYPHNSIVFLSAGGLATGADETKTAEERVTYGGLANAILDPCYHQVCSKVKSNSQCCSLTVLSSVAGL